MRLCYGQLSASRQVTLSQALAMLDFDFSKEQGKVEDGAQDWASGNTGSVLSSSPDLLSRSKAHVSFFMLCFYLLFCICLAVLNGDVGTVSHYKLAWYLT